MQATNIFVTNEHLHFVSTTGISCKIPLKVTGCAMLKLIAQVRFIVTDRGLVVPTKLIHFLSFLKLYKQMGN